MEFDTMSGFVVDLLGYIPEARENPSVQWENIRFTVLNMEENWISRIKAEILPEQTAEEQPKPNKAKRLRNHCVSRAF
ncbi:MAG: transporter associated domain-containing protein [Ruminococcus callidus]